MITTTTHNGLTLYVYNGKTYATYGLAQRASLGK